MNENYGSATQVLFTQLEKLLIHDTDRAL